MLDNWCQCSEWWTLHQHVDDKLVTWDGKDEGIPYKENSVEDFVYTEGGSGGNWARQ